MINKEVKGQLARLLATENIIVEHRNVKTASFDVEKRLLTLPMWETASQDIYDLLVGHEVGHALFTPTDEWEKRPENADLPHFFVNVTEDARIEKLMKRKFPGLSRNFYRGYQELHAQDFFGISDEDPEAISFIDRVNLHFKVGIHTFEEFPFTEEELKLVQLAEDAETFDEALHAAREICKYSKSINQNVVQIETEGFKDSGDSSSTVEGKETEQSEDGQESKDKPQVQSDNSESTAAETQKPKPEVNQLESKTDKAWQENTEKMTSKSPYSPKYVNLPELDLKKILVNNEQFYAAITEYYDMLQRSPSKDAEYMLRKTHKIMQEAYTEYNNYRKEAQKEVNYLVKEFEMRKAADAYSRSAISRTGVLDTGKLHSYKFNEDLFKKVTVLPGGKNHGMIFVLDWSGSMSGDILACIKQVLNLCWFCRKVSIPFDVYSFCDNGALANLFRNNTPIVEPGEGQIFVDRSFKMVNLLSSSTNNVTFEQQAKMLYYIGSVYSNGGHGNVPEFATLTGTPLNEAVIAYTQLIPYFQKKYKVQKLSMITLTDGDSASLCFQVKPHAESHYSRDYLHYRVGANCVLRNQRTGRSYVVDNYDEATVTKKLLENVKDMFPEVTLIGIRLVAGTSVRYYVNRFREFDSNDQKDWSKNKCVRVKTAGYDTLYILSNGHNLSETVDFDVDEGASKAQIKNAFQKMLKKKTLNKKFLTTFIENVA